MKKILVIEIIEDEIPYLNLLDKELSKVGYEIFKATDGKEGLAIAKEQHPDLILLDIRMPKMDGLAMLDELRKDDYGKTAKVIILTNLEPSEVILQQILKEQPTYYFLKSDIAIENLLIKIEEVLTEQSASNSRLKVNID